MKNDFLKQVRNNLSKNRTYFCRNYSLLIDLDLENQKTKYLNTVFAILQNVSELKAIAKHPGIAKIEKISVENELEKLYAKESVFINSFLEDPFSFYHLKNSFCFLSSTWDEKTSGNYIKKSTWAKMSQKGEYSDVLFPLELVEKIESINLNKNLDFCFVGRAFKSRKRWDDKKYRESWFLDWVRKNFTDQSYFDACIKPELLKYWPTLGKYDYTKNPKKYINHESIENFDSRYFLPMKESKFVLAPAGDSPWSWRFYEAMLCKAIPIVQHSDHSWRNEKYKEIPFNFYTISDKFIYREDWVEENLELFLKYCTVS